MLESKCENKIKRECKAFVKFLRESKTFLCGFIFVIIMMIFLLFHFSEEFTLFLQNLGNLTSRIGIPLEIYNNIAFLLSSIIQSFAAILALLAATFVFYTSLFRNDSKNVNELYTELYENIRSDKNKSSVVLFKTFNKKYRERFNRDDYNKLREHFIKNPKIMKIDGICKYFKKVIWSERDEERIKNFGFKIGNENLEAMVRNVIKRSVLRGRKFNFIIFFFITSIFGGIGLFLMLNKATWLFVLFGIFYLGLISISILMLLAYLIRISNI